MVKYLFQNLESLSSHMYDSFLFRPVWQKENFLYVTKYPLSQMENYCSTTSVMFHSQVSTNIHILHIKEVEIRIIAAVF